ncbi:DUF1350 family protein [Gloeocapsa sp. PCC 73106]|uniref:DUF1350 family protein n=1 Tax=Gloeocapsa sp. PCC 73106 TaxID=102232 RepID=UPI0002ACAE9C|nr:DUF1350 family protein [Gloeocapsa sp. PCC 73106]ELR98175.1 Protein of unknown function (DUF1350) [Gloeocapsa sp. PCC 73106]
MEAKFKLIPLKFHWVAIHPKPIGVVYFIGGIFFGSFPNLSYRYLMSEIFAQGYTVIAIPYRFTFNHWSVALQIVKDLGNLRKVIYQKAQSLGYTDNLDLYLEEPTEEKPNYFWMGHSLGCKYVALLEILTALDLQDNDLQMEKVLETYVGQKQSQEILNYLKDVDFKDVSLLNQPSIFLAPVIASLQSAIPFPPLAQLLKRLGLDVEPNVEETRNLILNSTLFNLISLIAFENDKRAKETVDWFVNNLTKRLFKPVVSLPSRNHFAPLGWKNGDKQLATEVIDSISSLSEELSQQSILL